MLKTAAAVLASVGGAGAIILGLSSWFGKVWASRLMEADRAKHQQELSVIRDDLRRATEAELKAVQHSYDTQMDDLLRRRQIYERLIVAMRVFLTSNHKATAEQKKEFLATYDLCHLWASDSVLISLGTLLDLIKQNTEKPESVDQTLLRKVYSQSIIDLRKNAGFADTVIKANSFRVVSFI